MPDESPLIDPKQIWQNQPTEPIRMSLDEIRRRAHNLETKDRLAALVYMALALGLCVFFGLSFARTPYLVTRIGWAVLSLWCLYSVYHGYKWIWPRRLAADATFSASLIFYRNELERKRDYVRHAWRRAGLTWCFVGLAIVLVPPLIQALETAPPLLVKALRFFVLLGIWFALFFPMKKRKQNKLQREIDELNGLERENRS
jgi:hypothetical protein